MNYNQSFEHRDAEDAALFADLDYFSITNSTVSYLLNIKELRVWKWRTQQLSIPKKHRKKLQALVASLKQRTTSHAQF